MLRTALAALIAAVALLSGPALAAAATPAEIAAQQALAAAEQQHVSTLRGLMQTTSREVSTSKQQMEIELSIANRYLSNPLTAHVARAHFARAMAHELAHRNAVERLNALAADFARAQTRLAQSQQKLSLMLATQP